MSSILRRILWVRKIKTEILLWMAPFFLVLLFGCESRSSENRSSSPPSLMTIEKVEEILSGSRDELNGLIPQEVTITESSLKPAESGGGAILRFKWTYRLIPIESVHLYWVIDCFSVGDLTNPLAQTGVLGSDPQEYVGSKMERGKMYLVTLSAVVSSLEDLNRSRSGRIILQKITVNLREQ